MGGLGCDGGDGHCGWTCLGPLCYGGNCSGHERDGDYGRFGSDLIGGDNGGGSAGCEHGAGGQHGRSTRTLLSGDSRCPMTHQSPAGLIPDSYDSPSAICLVVGTRWSKFEDGGCWFGRRQGEVVRAIACTSGKAVAGSKEWRGGWG